MELGILDDDVIEAWVPFSEDSEILLRYIERHEVKRIVREATRMETVQGSFVQKYDDELEDELFALKAVKDWRGFTAKGVPLACTPENIKKLMNRFTAFGRFIREESIRLSNFVEKHHEEQEKN